MFYSLKRESNHTLKNSHTCTVVSIPAESRITRAVEQSLCICTSGIVPTEVVGILSTLINVCNEIYSVICATMIVRGRMKNIHLFRKIMKKIYLYQKQNNEKKKTGRDDNNAYWSSLTDNNCISNGMKRVKYYRDHQTRLLPRSLGLFCYHNNKNIRSLFVLPSLMNDMAWRKFITCTVVSIPTESRFTYTLRRSTGIFANSVFIAIVGGILSISADVWNETNNVYKNSWYTMFT